MIWLNFSAVSTLQGSLPAADADGATMTNAADITAVQKTEANLDKRMTQLLNPDLGLRPYLGEPALVWSKRHIFFEMGGVCDIETKSLTCRLVGVGSY